MKHERHYRSTDGRAAKLSRFRIAPYLQILLGVVLLALTVGLLYHVVLPLLQKATDAHNHPAAVVAAATDAPTPTPTAAPETQHALYTVDLKTAQHEIVIPEYQYAADVSVTGQTVCCAVGEYESGTIAFLRVSLYDTATATRKLLALPMQYKSIRFPCANDRWIVYLDATANGGGRIMAYDRTAQSAVCLKPFYLGLPFLTLDGDNAAWIERTGQTRDKLFVCDLNSGEIVTVAIFDNCTYGLSRPCLYDGKLLYVDPSGNTVRLTLATGETETLSIEGNVHDPVMNDSFVAYLDSNHAANGKLYVYQDGVSTEVAAGVVQFALGDDFVAYGRYDKNYVYFPADGTTFCTTRSDETAQFLTAGGSLLVWMDVTWRDKDVMEYMTIQ